MTATRRSTPSLLLLAAALSLAGCGTAASTATTAPTRTATPAAATSPAAAPSSPAPAPSPSASPAPCTSRSCIVYYAKSLVGGIAQSESVMTAISCDSSTVKHLAPGIWSVRCTATYSDGQVWDGIATVLLTQGKVTWEPTQQVQ
jgi:hypothetical protein